MPAAPSDSSRPAVAPAGRAALLPGGRMVPPLLPVLLPIVLLAVATALVFAWLFPPTVPGGAAPVPRFTDATAEAGLGDVPGFAANPEALTTLGGGVVCFDYDGDGHPDLFFVGSTAWPWEEELAKRVSRGSCSLWHNDGRGHFTDVTAIAGLNVDLQGMSAAAGDFDDDGRPDLFVTCVGTNHLFRNRGHGRFEDVTEEAGVGGEENTWSTGAAWLDYDGDGRLDLVVGHYARWPREVGLAMAFNIAAVGRSYGAPTGFMGAFPTVYRNLGRGRFAAAPGSAGLHDIDAQTGFPVAKTLAVVPLDANGDGRLDLLFSYLGSENALFLNQGGGAFRRWNAGADRRQEGAAAGLVTVTFALTEAMGADERLAALQAAALTGGARREEETAALRTKLGVALLDYDLDGRLDFFSGEGRAEAETNHFERGRNFAAAPDLWWNRGTGWLATPPATAGEGWVQPLTARGVAVADIDGDGDLDVVVAQNGGPPRLLRNDQRSGWPWLQVDLVATRGPREAGGARVEVHTPRRVLVQTAAPAMGFMAQSAPTLTFGLGDDARVRKIVVRWPDGTRQEVRVTGVNRRIAVTEP